MNRKSKGVTLIEILVTLSLIAILLTLAVPSFSNFIHQNRMTSQANTFLSVIQLARNEAIKSREPVTLLVEKGSDGNGWKITVTSTLGMIREIDMLSSVVVLDASSSIQFDELGRAAPTHVFGLQHQSCEFQQRRTITVNVMGRAQVSKENCV